MEVALRKESVDRNFKPNKSRIRNRNVALRKESVDRNLCSIGKYGNSLRSLSARRAWIEIFVPFDVIRPAIGRSPQGERG